MFGYRNQLHDLATGEIYMRHRQVIPELGIFTTPDPLGENGGTYGLYSYVSGDPVQWQDFSGLKSIEDYLGEIRDIRARPLESFGHKRGRSANRAHSIGARMKAIKDILYYTQRYNEEDNANLDPMIVDDEGEFFATAKARYDWMALRDLAVEQGAIALVTAGLGNGVSALANSAKLANAATRTGRTLDTLNKFGLNNPYSRMALSNSVIDTGLGVVDDIDAGKSSGEIASRALQRGVITFSLSLALGKRFYKVDEVSSGTYFAPAAFDFRAGAINVASGLSFDFANSEVEAMKIGRYFAAGYLSSKLGRRRIPTPGHLGAYYQSRNLLFTPTIGGGASLGYSTYVRHKEEAHSYILHMLNSL